MKKKPPLITKNLLISVWLKKKILSTIISMAMVFKCVARIADIVVGKRGHDAHGIDYTLMDSHTHHGFYDISMEIS